MTDLREKVARAIFDASTFYGEWDRQPEANREVCFSMADAALAEIGTVSVRELEWEKSLGRDSLRSYKASDDEGFRPLSTVRTVR